MKVMADSVRAISTCEPATGAFEPLEAGDGGDGGVGAGDGVGDEGAGAVGALVAGVAGRRGEAARGLDVRPIGDPVAPLAGRAEAAEGVDEALALLVQAERPVIIAGGGVMTAGAWPELIELAEKLNIPVATSLSGKGAINENHPLAVGVLGSYARKSANEIVANADLALIVGTRTGSQSTNGWTLPSREADIIHINVDPSELGRNYPANTKVAIAADAKVGGRGDRGRRRRHRPPARRVGRRGAAHRPPLVGG